MQKPFRQLLCRINLELQFLSLSSNLMTQDQVAVFWAARRTKADQIIANAPLFKVCDQCRCIMRKHAGKCAVCGAYRFREEVASVRAIAKKTKQSPFPLTAGTVPRF